MTLLHQAAQKAVEAARIAFEQDAKQRSGGTYADINLRATRTSDGYINPVWDGDWRLWLRAWQSALQHQEVPSDKQIARAFADEQMRQGSGTHNRHEWFRRGALWAASPSTTRQQEVGNG